jgi:dihydroxyacetone kinase-like protein
VGVILRDTGLILISQTGGTVGPLYGTAFIRAGDVVKGKTAVDVHDIAQMFEAAEQGIMEVGGSKPGEKTMLDAIHPATLEMKKAVQCDKALIIAFESCVEAAEAGMKATINMVSKCGRSRYLGERSRGHQDVGATSVYLVLKSALHTLATLRHFHK